MEKSSSNLHVVYIFTTFCGKDLLFLAEEEKTVSITGSIWNKHLNKNVFTMASFHQRRFSSCKSSLHIFNFALSAYFSGYRKYFRFILDYGKWNIKWRNTRYIEILEILGLATLRSCLHETRTSFLRKMQFSGFCLNGIEITQSVLAVKCFQWKACIFWRSNDPKVPQRKSIDLNLNLLFSLSPLKRMEGTISRTLCLTFLPFDNCFRQFLCTFWTVKDSIPFSDSDSTS